ncbi:unnamed protein product, partial [Prorocentrum cordatum]
HPEGREVQGSDATRARSRRPPGRGWPWPPGRLGEVRPGLRAFPAPQLQRHRGPPEDRPLPEALGGGAVRQGVRQARHGQLRTAEHGRGQRLGRGRVVLRQPRVQLRQARRAQPRRGGRRAPRPQDVPPRGRPLPLREVAAGAAGGRVSLGPRHGAPCEAGLPDHGGQLGEGLRVLHDEQQVPAWGRGLHEVEADSRAGQHGGVELQERPAALRRDQGHPSLGGLGQRDEVPLPERLLWQTAARRRSRPAARRGRCPEARRRRRRHRRQPP